MYDRLNSTLIMIFALVLFSSPAFGIKITGGTSFASSFHIGFVDGPGLGLNFGLDAGIPIEAFEIGAEVEQMITDSGYDTNINATKFGALVRYQAIEDFLSIGVHAGVIGYITSKDISFHDTFSDKKVTVKGETKGSASYVAGSVDFTLGDFMLTPKVSLLNINKGYLPEIDINLGARF